jgi:hypothetical protein
LQGSSGPADAVAAVTVTHDSRLSRNFYLHCATKTAARTTLTHSYLID